MKTIKAFLLIIICTTYGTLSAQENNNSDVTENKQSYYEKRANEDAEYEQQFKSEDANEEAQFWKDQKQYEKDLKKRDRKAYKAYMRGKRDAYAEHYNHCNHSCHHSDHYYHHASFYYHGYHYYESRPSRTSVRTNIRVGLPNVRIGF